jgi:transposase
MHITSVGIDLGKTTFHLVALGEHGKVVARKKFSRKQLLAYTEFAAWLGLVPRQHSTGGKAMLYGISKRAESTCVGCSSTVHVLCCSE